MPKDLWYTRTDDTNWDIQINMPKELIIPIKMCKETHKGLMIPIENSQNVFLKIFDTYQYIQINYASITYGKK